MANLLSARQRKAAVKTFEGFKEAERIIAKERRKDLDNLTIKEGFARFDELCKFHDMLPHNDYGALEKKNIMDFCKLRSRMNLIGKKYE